MPTYRFRPVLRTDEALVARWREEPEVRRWWGDPTVEPVLANLDDPRIAPWIVELDGHPFAYAQDYDVHGWENHPFAHLPSGARGIDQYIGEPDLLGRGHGSAFVRQHAETLLAQGVPAIGTDPHPDNLRAIRAYEKAGFVVVSGPRPTRWGLAILMERWPAPTP